MELQIPLVAPAMAGYLSAVTGGMVAGATADHVEHGWLVALTHLVPALCVPVFFGLFLEAGAKESLVPLLLVLIGGALLWAWIYRGIYEFSLRSSLLLAVGIVVLGTIVSFAAFLFVLEWAYKPR